jgi:hypothetical protein
MKNETLPTFDRVGWLRRWRQVSRGFPNIIAGEKRFNPQLAERMRRARLDLLSHLLMELAAVECGGVVATYNRKLFDLVALARDAVELAPIELPGQPKSKKGKGRKHG